MTGTVALPIWNSYKIAWLCLESLCRQKDAGTWELIVFEELHPQAIGEGWLRGYEERLKQAGCERVLYLTQKEKLSLSRKWVRIAKEASGDYFVLCAADNYYSPFMLKTFNDLMGQCDWMVTTHGFFYDFMFDKVIEYSYNSLVGLQMAARTEYVRDFPEMDLKNGIDTWFSQQMIQAAHSRNLTLRACIDITDNWKNILCTNGLNNISMGRYKFFLDPQAPFYPTKTKLEEIVPDDIVTRIRTTGFYLEESKKVNDDLCNSISIQR